MDCCHNVLFHPHYQAFELLYFSHVFLQKWISDANEILHLYLFYTQNFPQKK